MTNQQLSTRQLVELELVKEDTFLYFEVMFQLSKMPSGSILFPSLIPYLSLFAIESYNYLHRSFPAHSVTLTEGIRPIITSSRMRVKFFDDTKKEVEGTLDILDWIRDFHHEWHIRQHTGILAPLKRLLQDDLGVTFYKEHIISSTHTGILNIGYSKDDLPTNSNDISPYISQLSFTLGQELGSYVTRLISLPEVSPHEEDFGHFNYDIQDSKLKYKDEKSERLLQQIFNGAVSKPINLSLLLFLSHINFLSYIFRNLVTKKHYTLFKLQYIVLYHIRSSLEKLKVCNQSNPLLTKYSINYIEEIISDTQFIELTSKRQFRNILVHYGIGKDLEDHLSLHTELYGLTEYFFNGSSYETILTLVEVQTARVSMILENWLSWHIQPSKLQNW